MKSLKIIFPLILVILVSLVFVNKSPAVNGDISNSILIFTTPTCPHCTVVKDYIRDNQLDQKLHIAILDATKPEYSYLLEQKASVCQLDPNSIGVPFYSYQDECLMGDQPIIDKLAEMLQ